MGRYSNIVYNTNLNEDVTGMLRKKVKHPTLFDNLQQFITGKIDSTNFTGEYSDREEFERIIRKLGFKKANDDIMFKQDIHMASVPSIRYFHIRFKAKREFTLKIDTIEIF